MALRTAELEGALLDLAVAKACGYEIYKDRQGIGAVTWVSSGAESLGYIGTGDGGLKWNPSGDWGQGGPIIEREKISLMYVDKTYNCPDRKTWSAYVDWIDIPEDPRAEGRTALEAAMRAFVALRLGPEITDFQNNE